MCSCIAAGGIDDKSILSISNAFGVNVLFNWLSMSIGDRSPRFILSTSCFTLLASCFSTLTFSLPVADLLLILSGLWLKLLFTIRLTNDPLLLLAHGDEVVVTTDVGMTLLFASCCCCCCCCWGGWIFGIESRSNGLPIAFFRGVDDNKFDVSSLYGEPFKLTGIEDDDIMIDQYTDFFLLSLSWISTISILSKSINVSSRHLYTIFFLLKTFHSIFAVLTM